MRLVRYLLWGTAAALVLFTVACPALPACAQDTEPPSAIVEQTPDPTPGLAPTFTSRLFWVIVGLVFLGWIITSSDFPT